MSDGNIKLKYGPSGTYANVSDLSNLILNEALEEKDERARHVLHDLAKRILTLRVSTRQRY